MKKKRQIIYWILIGIWISLAAAAVTQTKEGNLQQFYQDGEIDDWSMAWMIAATNSGKYDAASAAYVVMPGSGAVCLTVTDIDKRAREIKLDITDIQGNGSLWLIAYFDKNGNVIEQEEYEAGDGIYQIKLSTQKYKYLTLSLCDDRDAKLQVNNIKLQEYENTVDMSNILTAFAWLYLVWLLIGITLSVILKKNNKERREEKGHVRKLLEHSADMLLDSMAKMQKQDTQTGIIRIFLIIWLIIGWRVANVYGVNKHYGYIVLFTIVIYLAFVFYIPLKKEKRSVYVPLAAIWLVMCGMQLISDLLTQKDYGFSEIWMLLCFGLLYRAWGRMERPEQLLDDFSVAVSILNIFNILYFWFGNGKLYNDGRPTGTWSNPNPFAIGMVLYQAIALFLLYQAAHHKKKWWYYVLPAIEFVCGIWMIYVAQCRTALLAFGLLMVWFLGYLVIGYMKISPKTIALFVTGAVVLSVVCLILILHIGNRFSNRTINTSSANGLSSGRIWIWREYLGHMNLIGHEKYLVIGGKSWFAHNGIVKSFYKFGLFGGISYVLFLLEAIWAALCYWMRQKKSEYTILVMGVLIAYFIPNMMESMDELPMVWIGWVAFYFMIGYLMHKNENENQGKIYE